MTLDPVLAGIKITSGGEAQLAHRPSNYVECWPRIHAIERRAMPHVGCKH
jgi:hypothetical protein